MYPSLATNKRRMIALVVGRDREEEDDKSSAFKRYSKGATPVEH